MKVVSLPVLTTYWPGEPPVPPFSWRLANFGPVKVEVLYDSCGRQLFRDSTAVIGKTYPNKRWTEGGAA